jgi:hypothetical protein
MSINSRSWSSSLNLATYTTRISLLGLPSPIDIIGKISYYVFTHMWSFAWSFMSLCDLLQKSKYYGTLGPAPHQCIIIHWKYSILYTKLISERATLLSCVVSSTLWTSRYCIYIYILYRCLFVLVCLFVSMWPCPNPCKLCFWFCWKALNCLNEVLCTFVGSWFSD